MKRNPRVRGGANGKKADKRDRAVAKKWTVRRFRRGSASGVVYLDFSFPTAGGAPSRLCVPRSDLRRPKLLMDHFWDRDALFPGKQSSDVETMAFINALVSRQPKQIEIIPDQPGFIDKGSFATFDEIIYAGGTRRSILRTEADPTGFAGDIKGTLANSRKDVLLVARKSTYLAFGIGVALAAPLPKYLRIGGADNLQLQLTETASFNFSGPSGSGKTTIAKVAQSLSGNPDRLGIMNFSERGLAEYAAANNDMVTVLDDTEKASTGLAELLKHAIHGLSGGRSKIIARDADASVAKYPPLRWSTLGISSSPRPLPLISAEAGRPLTRGDLVRLFDISVPAAKRGGIFDRLSGNSGKRARRSIKLVGRLERGYQQNHGLVFPEWIQFLLEGDRRPTIAKAVAKFVKHVGASHDGWEKRFAQKFGLVYAALKLGVAARILPWSNSFCRDVADKCYRSARKSVVTDAELVRYHCRRLSRRLMKKGRLIDHPGSGSIITVSSSCIALRYKTDGRPYLGVFDDALLEVTGSRGAKKALTTALMSQRVVKQGHGHAGTVQEHLPISRDGRVIRRPHVWAFDVLRLQELNGVR